MTTDRVPQGRLALPGVFQPDSHGAGHHLGGGLGRACLQVGVRRLGASSLSSHEGCQPGESRGEDRETHAYVRRAPCR
jgi:hypothetical protein